MEYNVAAYLRLSKEDNENIESNSINKMVLFYFLEILKSNF